jgi:hypothetical protein
MHIYPFRRDDAYKPIPLEAMQKDPVETMHESSCLRQKTQTQTYYKYHCEGTPTQLIPEIRKGQCYQTIQNIVSIP